MTDAPAPPNDDLGVISLDPVEAEHARRIANWYCKVCAEQNIEPPGDVVRCVLAACLAMIQSHWMDLAEAQRDSLIEAGFKPN